MEFNNTLKASYTMIKWINLKDQRFKKKSRILQNMQINQCDTTYPQTER